MEKLTDRLDRITHIPEEYLASYLPAPKCAKIELTGKCQHNCAYCGTALGLRPVAEMDQELYKKITLDLIANNVKELGMFFLGESTLCSYLPEAIKFAKDNGAEYVFLTTNGTSTNEEQLKVCMDAGLNSLKFSFNYANAEQFENIARVKPKMFKKLLDNIKVAHKLREENGYNCGLYASYINYDRGQRKRMTDIIEEMSPYLDEIYELPLYSHAALVDDGLATGGADVTPGNRGHNGNPVNSLPCWVLFTEAHVTWDGKLAACCFGHEDRFTMGDLSKEDFADAWNSEIFQELRQAHLEGQIEGTACESCLAFG